MERLTLLDRVVVDAKYAEVTTTVVDMPRSTEIVIAAEMVANVLTLEVEVGDVVEAGSSVMLLESMKMEIPVISDLGGTVAAVKVTEGDVVQEGDVLVVLTPAS